MKNIVFSWCVVTALMLTNATVSPAAASILTISPAGGGSFVLQGSGLEKAAAFEIMLAYDSSSLSNPRVTQGALVSRAMMAVNTTIAGTVRIALITVTPVSGSGPIATLSFDQPSGSSGKLLFLNAKLADLNGQLLPVTAQVAVSREEPASTATVRQNQTQATAAAPTSGTSGPVTTVQQQVQPQTVPIITGPPEAAQKPAPPPEQEREQQPMPENAREQEPITIAMKPGQDRPASSTPARNVYAHTSVLDRFREFKGNASPEKYLSLFERDMLLGYRQEPLVALSGGNARVKMTFISVPGGRNMREIALAGGTLISLHKDADQSNTWIADIQPAKGEVDAHFSILQKDIIIVYPLTIAPNANIDLDKSGSIARADFALFLKERGSVKKPRFDLNADGKRDYLDDYIFTANYIAAGKAPWQAVPFH